METKLKLSIDEIVNRFKKGETFVEIAKDAGVSKGWVAHLIRRHVPTEEVDSIIALRSRPAPPLGQFTATSLDPGLKDALRGYCRERNVSMSSFIALIVEDKLRSLGVPIVRKPIYTSEPLPLESICDCGVEYPGDMHFPNCASQK